MTTLDSKAKFFHVIDAHRWLAASGCAWNLVGANAANKTKKKVQKLLPNIDVMARDGVLLHARSLIKFYLNRKLKTTDIVLSDFGVSVAKPLRKQLERYEQPIEVHLFHLTAWRDLEYRNQNAKDSDAMKARPDWDSDTARIVDLVLEAVKSVSECKKGIWPRVFKDLYQATTERYRTNTDCWPAYLGEKPAVESYLKGLGL